MLDAVVAVVVVVFVDLLGGKLVHKNFTRELDRASSLRAYLLVLNTTNNNGQRDQSKLNVLNRNKTQARVNIDILTF